MANKLLNFRCPDDLFTAIESFGRVQYPKSKADGTISGDQSKAIIYLLKLGLEAHNTGYVLQKSDVDVKQTLNSEMTTLLSSIKSELQSMREKVSKLESSIEETKASLSSVQDNLRSVENSMDGRMSKLERSREQLPEIQSNELKSGNTKEISKVPNSTFKRSPKTALPVRSEKEESLETSEVSSFAPQPHSASDKKTSIDKAREQILKKLKIGTQSPTYKTVAKALNNFIDQLDREDPNKTDLTQIRSEALESIKSGRGRAKPSDIAAANKALDDLIAAIAKNN